MFWLDPGTNIDFEYNAESSEHSGQDNPSNLLVNR